MAVPTLTAILKRILKQPSAPFHEYYVISEIEALLKDCPNVKLKRDKFGNLIATYKHGKKRSSPTWVLAAHMDHPGFVRPVIGGDGKDDWEFLGGVPEKIVANGVKKGLRKPVKGGRIATWNFPVTIDEERISGPACDDLIGCSAIISTFWEMARLNLEGKVHAAFTAPGSSLPNRSARTRARSGRPPRYFMVASAARSAIKRSRKFTGSVAPNSVRFVSSSLRRRRIARARAKNCTTAIRHTC